MPTRRRTLAVSLGLVVVLGGAACEEWNVDSCTPVILRIDAVANSSVTVSLRSGDQPLRRQPIEVEARAGGETVTEGSARSNAQGEATLELTPGALDQADEVVTSYPGTSGFCPATAVEPVGR